MLVALLGLVTVACGDTPGDGEPGDLGVATFDYVCANDGDVRCSMTGAVNSFDPTLQNPSKLPAAVAVGSQFGLEYGGTSYSGIDEVLVTVRPVVSDDELASEIFSISQPVEATFLAIDNQGEVIDFTAVEALEATALSVWYDQESIDDLTLQVGEKIAVTVVPEGKGGILLAGALPYAWKSLNSARVTLAKLGDEDGDDEVRNQGDIEILGVKEGSSVVRVRSGYLEKLIEIEVVP